jgi:hypothetical protein
MTNRRKQLERLWRENSECHWCGQTTLLLPPGSRHVSLPNLATRDHLRSRLDPARWNPPEGEYLERRIVLACWKCNAERCRNEQLAIPIEERRRLSSRHPRHGIGGELETESVRM